MDALLEKLRSLNVEEQLTALDDLIEARRADMVSAVLPLLGSAQSSVREYAAKYLGFCAPAGDAHVGKHLMTLLTDPDEFARGQAARSLGLLRYLPALSEVERIALRDAEFLVRIDAIEALESFGRGTSLETLVQALTSDPHPLVRRFAADAIRVVSEPRHRETIESLAETQRDEPINRLPLLIASYKLGKQDALGEICQLLDRVEDDEDMDYLLHILEKSYRGDLPPHVIAEIPGLAATIAATAHRLPTEASRCGELQQMLVHIQEGKRIPFEDTRD